MGVQGEQLQIVYKQPVRAATTANIASLASGAPDTLDGVTLVQHDRVLVKNQSTGAQNGIYRVATVGTGSNGVWVRARDFDAATADSITAGTSCFVQEGTAAAKVTYVLTTTGTIVLDSTSLTFEEGPTAGATAGDVNGPGSSTDTAIAKWNGTGGDTLANSTILIDGSGNLVPSVTDSNALGTSSLQWSDLFLASGAVINIANGDVTLTHSANALAFGGATSGYSFDNPITVSSGNLTVSSGNLILTTGSAQFAELSTPPSAVASAAQLYATSTLSPNTLAAVFEGGLTTGIPGSFQMTVLHTNQLEAPGAALRIRQATLIYLTANPVADDVFSLTDGTTTRTYGATSSGDVQYTIGGTVADTLQNIASAITGDGSGLWDAVYEADYILSTGGCVVIYRAAQAASSYNDRIYATWATPSRLQYIRFDQAPDYRRGATVANETVPGADPAAKRFGPGRSDTQVFEGDIHPTLLDSGLYMAFRNGVADAWNAVGGGGGLGGTTGGTDDAVLLADGTGGSTVKTSSLTIANIRDYNPVKRPCRVATTGDVANTATGAPDTVDGVSLAVNDRILVWKQDDIDADLENGIYTVTTVGTGADGVWARALDWDSGADDYLTAGNTIYVQEGSLWARTTFTLVTTGTITVATTATEFIPEGGLARTDASSTEVIASTAFTNGTFVASSTINMRDHSEIAVFFDPTNLGTNTQVDIVVFWSDDGTTIPFATDDNIQQSDFDIVNQTDGSYNPKPYTARLTTAGSELVVNQKVHLVFPKGGGACRIGVKGNAADGAFNVRTQRLVS